jgi:hypothetical protein
MEEKPAQLESSGKPIETGLPPKPASPVAVGAISGILGFASTALLVGFIAAGLNKFAKKSINIKSDALSMGSAMGVVSAMFGHSNAKQEQRIYDLAADNHALATENNQIKETIRSAIAPEHFKTTDKTHGDQIRTQKETAHQTENSR